MIVKDEALLDEFRGPGLCQFCGKWNKVREPHHWKPKGAGGGSRLDIRENIISMGFVWGCGCHDKAENAKISREAVLAKIAAREGKNPEECQQIIHDKLRQKK